MKKESAGGPGDCEKRKACKGLIQARSRQRDQLSERDNVAAVDSDLAILLSAPYQLEGMQPNPGFRRKKGQASDPLSLLMVSRTDGPSVEVAERLVTMFLDVERDGLTGTL
ncbi:MAG: hypothetical protein R3231_11750 [bacterium]|nr:hypothetical protein [bacterium]